MRSPKSSTSTSPKSNHLSSPTTGEPRQLEFYVDISLGGKRLPEFVRAAGHKVTTKEERYGQNKIEDARWIEECGRRNEVVLTKDERIKTQFGEWSAAFYGGVRVFLLSNQSLPGAVQVDYFRRHWGSITTLCVGRDGPYLILVYSDHLKEYTPTWPHA